jgi:hypothetical protein
VRPRVSRSRRSISSKRREPQSQNAIIPSSANSQRSCVSTSS